MSHPDPQTTPNTALIYGAATAPDTSPNTALILIDPVAISTVLAGDTNDLLGKLAEELKDFTPDISTEKGRAEYEKKRTLIRRTKTAMLDLADTLSEDFRTKHKAIVADKKFIETRLVELERAYMAQLDEYKAQVKAREKIQSDSIQRMLTISDPALTIMMHSSEIEQTLVELRAFEQLEWDMAFRARASDVYAAATDRLNAAHAAAVKREADAAELERRRAEDAERQRQADEEARRHREAELARKAAEAARIEAEQKAARELAAVRERAAQEIARKEAEAAAAIQAQKDAAARAERARVQAEADAKAAAERAAQEAERRQREAVEQEKRRSAAERQKEEDARRAQESAEAKRAADKEHRKAINRAALEALMSLHEYGQIATPISEAICRAVIVAIAENKIPRVSIDYRSAS